MVLKCHSIKTHSFLGPLACLFVKMSMTFIVMMCHDIKTHSFLKPLACLFVKMSMTFIVLILKPIPFLSHWLVYQ